jgi:predicted HicB family RNase H-like nuclease
MVMKSFVVRLDEDLWEKFTIKCVKNRKSKNEVIVELIKSHVRD